MNGLSFPDIDPIAFSLGPISIHWYAMAYLIGFLGGWAYALHLLKTYAPKFSFKPHMCEELLPWVIIGVIIGGRLVYGLVYNPVLYAHNFADIFKVWQGGMSFHGGMLGAIVGMALFARKNKIPFLAVTDIAAVTVPIGLFFGRIANFVNGELYGRVTDLPWAFVFPNGGPLPRHPSQLYESLLEGLILGLVLYFLARKKETWAKEGLLSGVFMIGYGLSRFTIEFVRQPDAQLGFFAGVFSMGQILCVPMIGVGAWILWARWKRLNKS